MPRTLSRIRCVTEVASLRIEGAWAAKAPFRSPSSQRSPCCHAMQRPAVWIVDPGMKAAIPSGKRYRYGKRRPGAGRVMKHLVAGEPPAQNRRAFGGHAGVAGADWTSGASADDGHRAIRSPKLSRSRGVSANGAGLGRLGLGNACFPASVTFRPTCAAMLS
jgi:hypothetical protein